MHTIGNLSDSLLRPYWFAIETKDNYCTTVVPLYGYIPNPVPLIPHPSKLQCSPRFNDASLGVALFSSFMACYFLVKWFTWKEIKVLVVLLWVPRLHSEFPLHNCSPLSPKRSRLCFSTTVWAVVVSKAVVLLAMRGRTTRGIHIIHTYQDHV